MRVTFPLCAVGITSLSLWATGSLLTRAGPPPPPPRSPGVETAARESLSAVGDARSATVAGTHVIRGRIVDARSGRPIAGARISVQALESGPSWDVSTSPAGSWEVSGLPGGEYAVSATKPDYQPAYRWSPPIALSDAKQERVIEIRMSRGGLFSGRVTADGRPAPGVRVGLLRVTGVDGDGFQFAGDTAGTDEHGQFRLSGIQDGEYVLAAIGGSHGLAGEGSRRSHITTFYPNTTSARDARRFTVRGGTSQLDLEIALKWVPTFRVSGRVLSSRSEPVDATISFSNRDDAFFPNGSTSYGPQGGNRFVLPRLIPGRYRIQAKTSRANGRPEAATVDVTIGDSDITDVEIRTEPAVIIRGRILAEPRYDNWRLDWMRLTGMPVDVRESSDGEPAAVRADRTFEIETHHAPARLVAIEPTGGWDIKSLRQGGREVVDGVLSAAHGDTISDVDVVLQRRASIVEGTVRDASDCTYVIVLRRAEHGRAACVASSPVRDGEFRTLPLLPGHYRVVAAHGPFTDPLPAESLWNAGTPVTLTDDQTLRLTLTARTRP